MVELVQIFAEARALRKEAERARKLAGSTTGRLQGELHEIAALYEKLADGKDPENPSSRHATLPIKPPRSEPLARFFAAWPD